MRFACLALVLMLQDTDPVAKFADSLKPGDDDLVKRFQTAVKTRAGRVVLSDRAARMSDELRKRAEKSALPDWFLRHFEDVDGRFRLRAGQEEWRRDTLAAFESYQVEIERLKPVLKDVASKLVDVPEINARLKAYLSHPAAPHVIYYRDLRPKATPDVYVLQKAVGQFVAPDADGRLIVPEGLRAHATAAKTLAGALVKAAAEASKPFAAACEKLTAVDDLNARIKAAVKDPLFLGLVLKKAAGEFKPESADEQAQKIRDTADQLVGQVEDGIADGRVKEEAREQVREILDNYDAHKKRAALLREPARQLARMIKAEDALAKELGEMLQTDIVLALLSQEIRGGDGDAIALLKERIREGLTETADGKLRIHPDREAEAAGEIKDPAKAFRDEEKALRLVSEHGGRIEDAELKAAFTAPYGRFVVEDEAKAALAAKTPDGLGAWIARHFENGALKAGSRAELEGILAQVKALEAKAANDDLK
ncbi:MAG TPA: hypothetical protein VF950_01050 [Planctomycetota bacterium]